MEYEDTNILRTQYVDDLVNQRQALEDALVYQESPVVSGEGLNTMVPKVQALTGTKAILPFISFYNCNPPSKDVLGSINLYNMSDFSYMFAQSSYLTGKTINLSEVYFGKIKITKGMFRGIFGTITTNDSFNCEEVTDATDMLGISGSGYTGHWYKIRNSKPWVFKKLEKADGMFQGYPTNTNNEMNYPILITSPYLKTMTRMFSNAYLSYLLETMKNLCTTNVIDASSCFSNCYLGQNTGTTLPVILGKDWSNLENAASMFSGCSPAYATRAELDFSEMFLPKLITGTNFFHNISYITAFTSPTIPNETLTDVSNFVTGGTYILTVDISRVNLGAVKVITNMITGTNITSINFGYNLGKGYTQKSKNYSNYKLNLANCAKLTAETVNNIFQKIYDLNLSYNVANGGTLYTQQIDLHADVIALMTAEEIAVATDKGWTVL